MWSILWAALGIVAIITGLAGSYSPKVKKVTIVLGVLCLLYGVSAALAMRFGTEQLAMRIVFSGLGIVCFIPGYMLSRNSLRCRARVTGAFLRMKEFPSDIGITAKVPVFRYQWQGREYECAAAEPLPSSWSARAFFAGDEHTIFLCAAHPEKFICTRKIWYSLFVVAILCFAVAALM